MATLDDLAETLVDVRIMLAEINGRLSTALATVADHEDRVRRLERWRWTVAGVGAASGALTGAALTIIQATH